MNTGFQFVVTITIAALVAITCMRPTNYLVSTGIRALLLPLIASNAYSFFSSGESDQTVVQVIIIGCILGWLAASAPMTVLYPTPNGDLRLRANAIERQSLQTALASGAMIVIMLLLQISTNAAGVRGSRADPIALASFAVCFGAWFSLIASLTLPWAVHRRWTLSILGVTAIGLVILIPVSWSMSNGDTVRNGFQYDGYSGNGGPFDRATSASSGRSATFAASPAMITANILGLVSIAFAVLRYLVGQKLRIVGPTSDEIGEHVVGSGTQKEA